MSAIDTSTGREYCIKILEMVKLMDEFRLATARTKEVIGHVNLLLEAEGSMLHSLERVMLHMKQKVHVYVCVCMVLY